MYARPTATTGMGADSVETWKGDGGIIGELASLSRPREATPRGNDGYVEMGTRGQGISTFPLFSAMSEDSHYPRYLSG